MIWTYQVLSRTGEEISGAYEGQKAQALEFIGEHQWELIALKADYLGFFKQIFNGRSISSEVLAGFFGDFHNMFTTGMTLNQIIAALAETTLHPVLKPILLKTQEAVSQGESLSKALAFSRSMPWIVHSTIYAGESSGKLKETVAVLGDYFKRQGEVKNKIINATVYPLMVFVLLVAVMLFVSLNVVPKLQALLPPEAMENPATRFVLLISALLQKTWGVWVVLLIAGGFSLYHYCKERRDELEFFTYKLPLIGVILKESALSFYFLNLSVLLKSGVPLLKALADLEVCMSTLISRRFISCRDRMLGGSSFWEAINADEFFPPVIVHTLRRGEEAAKIPAYCENLTSYFQQRTQVKIDQIICLIQPFLLGMGGLFLVLIAFAFLLPIYGSITKISAG